MEVNIEQFSIEIGAARLAHEHGDVLMAGEENGFHIDIYSIPDAESARVQRPRGLSASGML